MSAIPRFSWTAFFTSADGIEGHKPTAVEGSYRPPYEQVRVAARPLRVWRDVADRPEEITNSRLVYRRYEIDRMDEAHRIVWYKEVLA